MAATGSSIPLSSKNISLLCADLNLHCNDEKIKKVINEFYLYTAQIPQYKGKTIFEGKWNDIEMAYGEIKKWAKKNNKNDVIDVIREKLDALYSALTK